MKIGNARESLFVSMVVVLIATVPPVTAEDPSNLLQVDSHKAAESSTSTVGLAAPAGAVVLFDGTNFHAWEPFSCQWITSER